MDHDIDQPDLQRVKRTCLQFQLRRVAKGVALENKLGKTLPQVSRDIELLFRMATTNLTKIDNQEARSDLTTAVDQKPNELPGLAELIEEFGQLGVVDRSLVLEAARKSSALQQLKAGGESVEAKSETVQERKSQSLGE